MAFIRSELRARRSLFDNRTVHGYLGIDLRGISFPDEVDEADAI